MIYYYKSMSFIRGTLTDEQKERIKLNRLKAEQRLKQRSGEKFRESGISGVKRPQIDLSEDQRKRIETNRKRALEIRTKKQQNNRDASSSAADAYLTIRQVDDTKAQGDRQIQRAQTTGKKDTKSREYLPSIKRTDYIEYDFATMKDSHGGFINADESEGRDNDAGEMTLDEWKAKQEQIQVVREPAPPLDISAAPKCFECGSVEIDRNLYENFNSVRVCRHCKKEKPEKYSLLTKTECREDYFLTDPELKDTSLLPRIEKPNPHGFSRMQLFLRFQVEQLAWQKWGSPEGLDQEWERREAQRIQRRDKKYNEKLLEMRKKTRAEQYIKKLRNGMGLGERHVHEWSAPLSIPGENNLVKRRCVDCGLEIEEAIL